MDAPERIEVESRQRLIVAWADGTRQELSAGTVRAACACADCRAGDDKRKVRIAVIGSEPPSIEDAQLVGAYGIRFVFGPDGHRTGIFTWEQLRALDA